MEEYIEQLLLTSLDSGLSEFEFWDMTPGEVIRLVQSRNKMRRLEAQERASYDYILANLIVKGVSLTLGGKGEYPTLTEAYPSLFDDIAKSKEVEIQERQDNLSALRFKQFAQSFNRRFQDKEVPKTINE